MRSQIRANYDERDFPQQTLALAVIVTQMKNQQQILRCSYPTPVTVNCDASMHCTLHNFTTVVTFVA